MKNLRKALFTLSLTFVLSACGAGGNKLDWNKVKNTGTGISLESGKVAKCSLKFDSEAFASSKKKADEIAVNKGSVYTFNGETEKVFNMVESLREKVTVSRAKYYEAGADEYKEIYDSLYEEYLGFYAWYYTFLQHVRDSSPEIYNSFFGDMSEKEVADYIQNFLYTEDTKRLDTEIEAIQNEQEEKYTQFVKDFRNQTIRMGDSGWNKYLNESLDNFRQVISKGGEYAAYYGYDNYLDYVYENWFNRNYKYDFVEDYVALVDQYVIPAAQYYENNVNDSVIKKTSKKKLFESFTSGNIADETYFKGDLLDAYVKQMGSSMSGAYDHMKNDGYFIFSNDPNSLGTAYVASGMDEPLIFFSSGYQNVSTIVHEFGHYHAEYSNPNNGSFPFDIEETHSQGNEMLFARYLSEYYKDSPDLDVYQYIQDYSVYSMLSDSILPAAVAKVESYVFENLDKTNSEILSGVNTIMSKYRALYPDGYDMIYAYWAAPIVSAVGYYISYATSAVASATIYIEARQDFETAKSKYLKFVAYPEECNDINTIFNYAGIDSPLEESTLQKLTHSNLYSF
ncbi:MAG: hypothetical protein J5618_02180 [Bacilli bacterium]|nr:hypothetical protein [Bacilli bacterium]